MRFRELFLAAAIGAGTILSHQARAQDAMEGFYGGLSLVFNDFQTDVGSNDVHEHDDDSAALGVYGGYLFVHDSGFVWGPEVMFTGLGVDSEKTDADLGTSKAKAGWLLSPRLRGGVMLGNSFFYGLAGLGITEAGAKPDDNDDTDINVSGALGVGVELAISDQWSTRGEVVTYGWDGRDYRFNGSKENVDTRLNQITFGLTRKF